VSPSLESGRTGKSIGSFFQSLPSFASAQLRRNVKQPVAMLSAASKSASFFGDLPNRASSDAAGTACRIPDGFKAAATIISMSRSTPPHGDGKEG
jgi:hypothetical protein